MVGCLRKKKEGLKHNSQKTRRVGVYKYGAPSESHAESEWENTHTHTHTNSSQISDSGLVKCEIRVSVLGHLQPLPKYQFHRILKSAIANQFWSFGYSPKRPRFYQTSNNQVESRADTRLELKRALSSAHLDVMKPTVRSCAHSVRSSRVG